MVICKKLSFGLVAATMLATPVMAQGVYREAGMRGFHDPNSRYITSVRAAGGPGYYRGYRFRPAPHARAAAAAPSDNGSNSAYGSYGLVARQW